MSGSHASGAPSSLHGEPSSAQGRRPLEQPLEALDVAVAVRGLCKRFGSREILRGVDLDIHEGESLILMGGSGSGKSTLLRCILGLEKPDEGEVVVLGTNVHTASPAELRELRSRLGVSFQNGALFGSMTVGENVELPLREHTELPASTRRLVRQMKLALVNLPDSDQLRPEQLSGGMRKRAALARALALDPRVLFCDEPSAGLDPITAAGLDQLLIRLRRVLGMTLVVVTHELESAFDIADRIAMLSRGKIRAVGTVDELRNSHDEEVRSFLERRADEAAAADVFEQILPHNLS